MKKAKRKNKKWFHWLEKDPGAFWVNFLYVFLIGISICYTYLIYGFGREVGKLEINVSPAAKQNAQLKKDINRLVAGYPMEKMSSHIASRDPKVAAYLVAIAKKESNWGKYSPKKKGRECYNYWGYRGKENPTSSGYSCFDSPKQAVRIVGGRIQSLIDKDLDTPRKMVVWKCGFDCSWDNSQNVQKWIVDVEYYYQKLGNY